MFHCTIELPDSLMWFLVLVVDFGVGLLFWSIFLFWFLGWLRLFISMLSELEENKQKMSYFVDHHDKRR
jgi:hypothetical protein